MAEEQRFDACFACGANNPVGLKLSFAYEGDTAIAMFDCSKLYEGYPGFIHGGIISTLLDEAMAKAILISGKAAVTAQISVKFRNPLLVGKKVQVKGWISEAKTRTIKTAAEVVDEDGTNIASAEAVFIVTGG